VEPFQLTLGLLATPSLATTWPAKITVAQDLSKHAFRILLLSIKRRTKLIARNSRIGDELNHISFIRFRIFAAERDTSQRSIGSRAHSLTKQPLVLEAEAKCCRPRRCIQMIAFPFVAAISEFVEHARLAFCRAARSKQMTENATRGRDKFRAFHRINA
jgi:hypothetical protein